MDKNLPAWPEKIKDFLLFNVVFGLALAATLVLALLFYGPMVSHLVSQEGVWDLRLSGLLYFFYYRQEGIC